jgi:4-hydroxyacetophenone monooxygenase
VALLQSKAAAFLKSYRDQGAGEIPYGPPERLLRSLSLAAETDIPASELQLWPEQLAVHRGREASFGTSCLPRKICRNSSWL